MKKLIFLLLAIQFSVFSYGQKKYEKKEYSEKYPNGQIKLKGYGLSEVIAKTDIAPLITATYTGLWEYWYENGNKQLEVLRDGKERYINMWLSDGTQILKNGNGYYLCYNNEKVNNPSANEKAVFIVKDSIITNVRTLLQKPPYVK